MSKELGKKLERLRESKGWSKTYVSKSIGISNMQTYANYEYGYRDPDLDTLKKISGLYDVSVDSLLGIKGGGKEYDIDEMMDNAMMFKGEPLTDNDREILRGVIEGYLKAKK